MGACSGLGSGSRLELRELAEMFKEKAAAWDLPLRPSSRGSVSDGVDMGASRR